MRLYSPWHGGFRRALSVLVLVLAIGMAAPASATPIKCQRAIARAGAQFVKARAGALAKCEGAVINGSIAGPCPDGRTATKLAQATTKLGSAIGKACGGVDKLCARRSARGGQAGIDRLAAHVSEHRARCVHEHHQPLRRHRDLPRLRRRRGRRPGDRSGLRRPGPAEQRSGERLPSGDRQVDRRLRGGAQQSPPEMLGRPTERQAQRRLHTAGRRRRQVSRRRSPKRTPNR